MKRLQSKVLLGLAAAAIVFAASPASAATWQCTAKNARGAAYTAVAIGVYSAIVHDKARAKALAKCAAGSVYPATCYIASCTKTG